MKVVFLSFCLFLKQILLYLFYIVVELSVTVGHVKGPQAQRRVKLSVIERVANSVELLGKIWLPNFKKLYSKYIFSGVRPKRSTNSKA
jgi:hypothetical protein